MEKYLEIIKNPTHRTITTKFRISNHNLLIEADRYNNPVIPRENRLCPVCTQGLVENELHVLFSCPLYQNQRRLFFADLLQSSIDVKSITDTDANVLMNNQNPEIIFKTSKYISDCFDIRNYTLNPGIS